jgi:hypothetical protein
MTPPTATPTPGSRLAEGYKKMLERVKTIMHEIESATETRLSKAIASAQDKAFELGELTREEAEKLGDYLRRDIEDAANYLTGPEPQELAAWLKFDIAQVEHRVLEAFLSVADQTKLELMELERRAAVPPIYRTGEVTSMGTLVCTQCGKTYHFYEPGHIPPCAACHNTTFARASE